MTKMENASGFNINKNQECVKSARQSMRDKFYIEPRETFLTPP